jgi:hypothetical protein
MNTLTLWGGLGGLFRVTPSLSAMSQAYTLQGFRVAGGLTPPKRGISFIGLNEICHRLRLRVHCPFPSILPAIPLHIPWPVHPYTTPAAHEKTPIPPRG